MEKLKKRKILKTIIISFVAIVLSCSILFVGGVLLMASPQIMFWIGMWISTPNPPEPEVTYGEFPFEIVYEIDGEIFTINDVYVCEYRGIALSEASGKCRSWKGYIKSSGE